MEIKLPKIYSDDLQRRADKQGISVEKWIEQHLIQYCHSQTLACIKAQDKRG